MAGLLIGGLALLVVFGESRYPGAATRVVAPPISPAQASERWSPPERVDEGAVVPKNKRKPRRHAAKEAAAPVAEAALPAPDVALVPSTTPNGQPVARPVMPAPPPSYDPPPSPLLRGR
jgi:hypothetical protein